MRGWLSKLRLRRRKPKRRYPSYKPRHSAAARQSPHGEARKHAPSARHKKRCGMIGTLWGGFNNFLRRSRFALTVMFVVFATYIWLSLPNTGDLDKMAKARSIIVKSENGIILGNYGDIYGDYVTHKHLPQPLIDAVLATEDRNFYYHFGVDPFGITRAMIANIRAGHVVQGGSTITQQLAKNLFLTPERTMTRKLRELILALLLEVRYSKDEILTIYLNRVYLGAGNYGVDAASRRYFGKSAREIGLPEAAILAGMLKAPSRFAPTSNPKLAQKRAEQVLVNMVDAEIIASDKASKARSELPQALKRSSNSSQGNMYFTDWIVDQLPDYIGQVEDDIEVTATLNPAYQQMASKAINEVLDKSGEAMRAEQAALVAIATDGAVRAMVGGRDYATSQFNRATQSRRQPGSAFKLFVYLTALENGMTASDVIEDKPISVGRWQPRNYNQKYEGEMTLREAVAQSVNTVAVQVAMQFGMNNVAKMAQRLGVSSSLLATPSLALGTSEVSLGELTTAYAHLAAGGRIVTPYGITEIRTDKGKVLYVREKTPRGQALSAGTVAQMNDLLKGVVQFGTGRAASIGRPVAGKTGTTSDYKDAWFVGYVPQLTTGVWVGNDDATAMKKVSGGTLPAQIWRGFMSSALSGLPAMGIPTRSDELPDDLMPWQQPRSAAPPAQPFPEAAPPLEEPDGSFAEHDIGDEDMPPEEKQARRQKKEEEEFDLGPDFWKALQDAAPGNFSP